MNGSELPRGSAVIDAAMGASGGIASALSLKAADYRGPKFLVGLAYQTTSPTDAQIHPVSVPRRDPVHTVWLQVYDNTFHKARHLAGDVNDLARPQRLARFRTIMEGLYDITATRAVDETLKKASAKRAPEHFVKRSAD